MRKGFFSVQQTCTSCHGNGTFIKYPCFTCNGLGKIKKNKKLIIKIPPGIDNHDKIKIDHEGEIGENGSNPGDLYIYVKVKKHNIFKRKNNNLYCEIPISFPIAALGGEVKVPTLHGKIKLKIPAETQSGKLFRVKGKGVKSIRSSLKGDLFCKIVVETPINLNNYQKNLLNELKNSLKSHKNEKNNPRSKRFFDGIKKFFDDLTK